MKGTFTPCSPLDLNAQAVIVGSGAGGASVADVLTRAGLDVVMLEEGPFVPAAETAPRASESFPMLWRNGGLTVALGAPPVAYAEGRCVGGGTEINSAIFQRTAPELLQDWARSYGIADFGPDELKPYFDRAAAAVNASRTTDALGPPSALLEAGGRKLGWAVSHLPRAQKHCVGTNMCAFGCPTGGKQSMTNSLLPLAVERGLRLIADTRVVALKRKGARVVAVEARGGAGRGHRIRVRADLVFVCAGAVHTPALLMRSGIRENVGRTLRLHPTVKCVAVFDETVDAHLHRLPLYAISEFMPQQRIGGSFFTPAIFATSLAEDWTVRGALMPEWRRCGVYYTMIRSGSTGRIRKLPGLREPVVTYQISPDDWVELRRALGRLAEAMFAAGARRVIPSIAGHIGWTSLRAARGELADDLRARDANLMTIHLFGSCPMGERTELCAADSFGRVHGLDNVYIADASLVPEAPGCNPQGTIMALAYRTAEAAVRTCMQGRGQSPAQVAM